MHTLNFDYVAKDTPRTLSHLAKLGLSHVAIADYRGVEPTSFTEKDRQEIKKAKLDAGIAFLEALYAMATSRRHLSAALLWIKTLRAQLFDQPPTPVEAAETGDAQTEALAGATEKRGRIVFSIYNNDGEPNADY